MTLEEIGSRAKAVSRTLNNLGSREKNIGLEEAARAVRGRRRDPGSEPGRL